MVTQSSVNNLSFKKIKNLWTSGNKLVKLVDGQSVNKKGVDCWTQVLSKSHRKGENTMPVEPVDESAVQSSENISIVIFI